MPGRLRFAALRRSGPSEEEPLDALEAVYRLNPKVMWQRMREEPIYFWLFCGYVFFEYFRPQTIYPIIAILPWSPIFLLGSLLAVTLDSREPKNLSGPLTFPVLGFFVVTFLSCVFAFNPSVSFSSIDVVINWILVYLLFLWIVNSRFRLFIVFLILLMASFKMAQFGFRVSLARGFAFQRWGIGGPSGWFQNAADLGVQMTIFTAWSVAFYYGLKQYWKQRWLRWLVLFFPVAGLVTALATNQRNTIVALGVMGLSLVVFSKNRFRNLAIVTVVAIVGFSLASDAFKDRFVNMEDSGTAVTRLDYWERGIGFYLQNPVIGVGYNNFVPYYSANFPGDVDFRGRVMVAHSVPVTIAAELGTVGIIFFLSVVLAILVTNLRSARIFQAVDPPFWRYLAISLNYGLLGFLVTGIFLSTAFYPFLWFQAGLTAALYGVASRERQQLAGTSRTPLRSDRVAASPPLSASVTSRAVTERTPSVANSAKETG